MIRLGYACINTVLNSGPKKKRVFTSRGMIKRTWLEKGLPYAAELALQNCKDLLTILEWNEEHDIKVFRISSELFPWMSEYELQDLPNIDLISDALKKVGDFATSMGHRISFHPGPYNVASSKTERVVVKTIKELNQHSEIFNMMGFEPSLFNKINIHVGSAQDGLAASAERFCKSWERLADHTKKRLTVENDDKCSMFSTKDLYELIHKKIGIAIVHDFHHHEFCDGGLLQEDALGLAAKTWGDITPVTHYSESRSIEQGDESIRHQAHSDFIQGKILDYGKTFDCVIEAKMKEQTLLRYRTTLQ